MHCLMRILITIAAQQKGFFISLGRKLAALGHAVYFAPRDKDVASLIKRLAPEIEEGNIIKELELEEGVRRGDAVKHGLELERKYGVRLSMLLSYDRALGRGYLFCADRYPQVRRAQWGYERKLAALLGGIDKAESLLDRSNPECILGLQKQPLLNMVADERGITYLSPAPVKLGNRFIWSDDFFITSTSFLRTLRENAAKPMEELPPLGEYIQETGSKHNHARIDFSRMGALLGSGRLVVNDVKKLFRGGRKKDSYKLFGWLPPVLRRPSSYSLLCRWGIRPNDLAGKRAVYVPLHLEPEIALLQLSPEFNNSMEMIAWISKCAPADTLVVVKEQPFSFGIRSRRFYEQLDQIGNVSLAHPETTSWEWIRTANVIATITGTAAIEAVMFGRPVLSFGRHQAVNLLPTVRLATDYESTHSGLEELLGLDPADLIFERSRRALYAAQVDGSFELPGFEKTYQSENLQDKIAEKALEGLLKGYPGMREAT